MVYRRSWILWRLGVCEFGELGMIAWGGLVKAAQLAENGDTGETRQMDKQQHNFFFIVRLLELFFKVEWNLFDGYFESVRSFG